MDEFKDTRPPNIRLKEGKEPITVLGKANVGTKNSSLRFGTEEEQKAGWHSKDPKAIVRHYPDRYELLNGGKFIKWLKADA